MHLVKMYLSLFVLMLQGPLSAGVQGVSLMVRSQLLSSGNTLYGVCVCIHNTVYLMCSQRTGSYFKDDISSSKFVYCYCASGKSKDTKFCLQTYI